MTHEQRDAAVLEAAMAAMTGLLADPDPTCSREEKIDPMHVPGLVPVAHSLAIALVARHIKWCEEESQTRQPGCVKFDTSDKVPTAHIMVEGDCREWWQSCECGRTVGCRLADGMKLIGTCGACAWYSASFGQCDRPRAKVPKPPVGYGCTDWEARRCTP